MNFTKKEITYPEAAGLVINERQTCNFDANENFVVLECVHRLLEKGYKPEHIELEPKWKLGRGASGGRADILLKDNDGRPLLIIECKTAGIEFKRAWNKTLKMAISYSATHSKLAKLSSCASIHRIWMQARSATPVTSSRTATTKNIWLTIRCSKASNQSPM